MQTTLTIVVEIPRRSGTIASIALPKSKFQRYRKTNNTTLRLKLLDALNVMFLFITKLYVPEQIIATVFAIPDMIPSASRNANTPNSTKVCVNDTPKYFDI